MTWLTRIGRRLQLRYDPLSWKLGAIVSVLVVKEGCRVYIRRTPPRWSIADCSVSGSFNLLMRLRIKSFSQSE